MTHPIIQKQFSDLQQAHPEAQMAPGTNGATIIMIPGIALEPASAWNKPETLVRYVAPVGYPQAKPDCFWADGDLRLAGGGLPKNAQLQVPPQFPQQEQLLWFSWHVSAWNPNLDTLLTYLKLVRRRLREGR